jgi:hypothetical protein
MDTYKVSSTQQSVSLLDRMETLLYAIDNDISMARLGDGELFLAFARIDPLCRILAWAKNGIDFQPFSAELSKRLWDTLTIRNDRFLVCYNNSFMQNAKHHMVMEYERSEKKYEKLISIRKENDIGVLLRVREQGSYVRKFEAILKHSNITTWGESTCVWLAAFCKEYKEQRLFEVLDAYRLLLEGKRVLFVCPEHPLLGSSFQSLASRGIIQSPRSIQFLEIPNKNAFAYYDSIKRDILKHQDVDCVFVQAGPTATALVADLATDMIAFDVGSWNVSLEKAWNIHKAYF